MIPVSLGVSYQTVQYEYSPIESQASSLVPLFVLAVPWRLKATSTKAMIFCHSQFPRETKSGGPQHSHVGKKRQNDEKKKWEWKFCTIAFSYEFGNFQFKWNKFAFAAVSFYSVLGTWLGQKKTFFKLSWKNSKLRFKCTNLVHAWCGGRLLFLSSVSLVHSDNNQTNFTDKELHDGATPGGQTPGEESVRVGDTATLTTEAIDTLAGHRNNTWRDKLTLMSLRECLTGFFTRKTQKSIVVVWLGQLF